jgi:trans-aconitate methyltransferase
LQSGAGSSPEWDPAEYARHSAVQYQAAQLVRKSLVLHGDEVVLDVGSGDGRITAEMSKDLPKGRIVGVDSSPAMVANASTTYPMSQYPNLEFQLQNAESLPFNEQFDLVVSFSTLHWVGNLETALTGIRRALKPGGKLAVTVVRGIYAPMEDVTDQLIRSPRWGKYLSPFAADYNFVQRDRYLKLLRQTGFTPVDVHDVSLHVLFASRNTFLPWVKQWYVYVDAIPADLRDQFLNEVVDLYLVKQPVDSQGQIYFVSSRLQIMAVRSDGPPATDLLMAPSSPARLYPGGRRLLSP